MNDRAQPQPKQPDYSREIGMLFDIEHDLANLIHGIGSSALSGVLIEPAAVWLNSLVSLRRQAMATRIILRAGFLPNEPIPDSAEPRLQALINCRAECPSPTYDSMYYVRVRQGRAMIVHRDGTTGYDKHFFEVVGGRYTA